MQPGSNDAPLLAHVLFMDIVGATKLATDEQRRIVGRLRELVRASEEFRCAQESNQLISVPSGDGMALAFFNRLDAAVLCAVEITRAIQAEGLCNIRMGVHTGPVYVEEDIRGQPNLSGAGINLAERVMSAGGAGHILISETVAASLRQLGNWRDKIHEVGDCQVKDGWVRVWNLVDGTVGNPATPKRARALVLRRRWMMAGGIVALALVVAAAAGSGVLWFERTSKALGDKASLAVLPFRDASPEKNQEPFAEGLAEDLRAELVKVPGLKVAGRESSAKFAGKSDYQVMARKLNVGTVLEGTVRTYANKFRITVRLIKAADGFAMWSEEYDRESHDIFAVQTEIARAVTSALKLALLPEQATSAKRSSNIRAYTDVQWGRNLVKRGTKEDLEKAAGYFEQATKLDSQYALAWEGLADVRALQVFYAYLQNPEEGKRGMRQALDRAFGLDPNLAEAHSALGWIKMNIDWDWAGAERSFQRARELAPGGYLEAIKGNAQLDANLGRFKEAIELHQRAMALDPLSATEFFHAGFVYYDAGRLTEAKTAFEKTLELDPEYPFTHCYFSQVYLAQGNPQGALAEAEKEKHADCQVYALALVYHALGREKESDANLAEAIAKYPKDMPYQIAEVYAFRGQRDQAIEWLRKAYELTDTGIVLMKVDPLLKNLHKDPGYTALLQKMNLQD